MRRTAAIFGLMIMQAAPTSAESVTVCKYFKPTSDGGTYVARRFVFTAVTAVHESFDEGMPDFARFSVTYQCGPTS